VARPTETTDEHLLEAADMVLMTDGPSAFTLAKAAERAGVSAATLIKRFGSKQTLFLRLSQRWFDSLDGFLGDTAAAQVSPLARFRAVALASYHDLDNPATASNQLAALAVDLQDNDMRELLDAGWHRTRRHLEGHATDAISLGELVGCPPPEQLARIVFAVMEGGCLSWSVRPEGSLVARLSDDLDALLIAWTDHRKEITT
jgi:AcrR family transcriptional regulator